MTKDPKLTKKAEKIISKVFREMFPGDVHTIKVEYEPRKVGGGKYYAPLPNGAIVEFSHKQLRDETDRNLERNARAQIGARASS